MFLILYIYIFSYFLSVFLVYFLGSVLFYFLLQTFSISFFFSSFIPFLIPFCLVFSFFNQNPVNALLLILVSFIFCSFLLFQILSEILTFTFLIVYIGVSMLLFLFIIYFLNIIDLNSLFSNIRIWFFNIYMYFIITNRIKLLYNIINDAFFVFLLIYFIAFFVNYLMLLFFPLLKKKKEIFSDWLIKHQIIYLFITPSPWSFLTPLPFLTLLLIIVTYFPSIQSNWIRFFIVVFFLVIWLLIIIISSRVLKKKTIRRLNKFQKIKHKRLWFFIYSAFFLICCLCFLYSYFLMPSICIIWQIQKIKILESWELFFLFLNMLILVFSSICINCMHKKIITGCYYDAVIVLIVTGFLYICFFYLQLPFACSTFFFLSFDTYKLIFFYFIFWNFIFIVLIAIMRIVTFYYYYYSINNYFNIYLYFLTLNNLLFYFRFFFFSFFFLKYFGFNGLDIFLKCFVFVQYSLITFLKALVNLCVLCTKNKYLKNINWNWSFFPFFFFHFFCFILAYFFYFDKFVIITIYEQNTFFYPFFLMYANNFFLINFIISIIILFLFFHISWKLVGYSLLFFFNCFFGINIYTRCMYKIILNNWYWFNFKKSNDFFYFEKNNEILYNLFYIKIRERQSDDIYWTFFENKINLVYSTFIIKNNENHELYLQSLNNFKQLYKNEIIQECQQNGMIDFNLTKYKDILIGIFEKINQNSISNLDTQKPLGFINGFWQLFKFKLHETFSILTNINDPSFTTYATGAIIGVAVIIAFIYFGFGSSANTNTPSNISSSNISSSNISSSNISSSNISSSNILSSNILSSNISSQCFSLQLETSVISNIGSGLMPIPYGTLYLFEKCYLPSNFDLNLYIYQKLWIFAMVKHAIYCHDRLLGFWWHGNSVLPKKEGMLSISKEIFLPRPDTSAHIHTIINTPFNLTVLGSLGLTNPFGYFIGHAANFSYFYNNSNLHDYSISSKFPHEINNIDFIGFAGLDAANALIKHLFYYSFRKFNPFAKVVHYFNANSDSIVWCCTKPFNVHTGMCQNYYILSTYCIEFSFRFHANGKLSEECRFAKYTDCPWSDINIVKKPKLLPYKIFNHLCIYCE